MGGWLENCRVIPISAFKYVIVEVVAEIGNMRLFSIDSHITPIDCIGTQCCGTHKNIFVFVVNVSILLLLFYHCKQLQ